MMPTTSTDEVGAAVPPVVASALVYGRPRVLSAHHHSRTCLGAQYSRLKLPPKTDNMKIASPSDHDARRAMQ